MKKLVVGFFLSVFCSCVLAETKPPAGGAAAGAGAPAEARTVPNTVWFVVGLAAAVAVAASSKSGSTTSH
jgi:hypothetical protein